MNTTFHLTQRNYYVLHIYKSTTLCAQYKYLQGVKNNEFYVLPSFHF
jgi:hypothetical protein